MSASNEKSKKVVAEAKQLFDRQCTWQEFQKQVMSANGLIAQNFSHEDISAFQASDEYQEIEQMLHTLVSNEGAAKPVPIRMLPTLHTHLKQRAKNLKISLNALCVALLMNENDDAALLERVGEVLETQRITKLVNKGKSKDDSNGDASESDDDLAATTNNDTGS